MRIERSTNCSSIEEIERMIKKANEDAKQNTNMQEELDLEHIKKVFEIMNSIPSSNGTNVIIINR